MGGGTPAGPELLGGPGNDELPMQLPGGGLPPPLDPPTLECEEPEQINTLRWTDREYVYGPGYVDEFILQIDQSGNILYMLQDANYNVVAIVSGGCGPGVPPENCGTGVPPVGTLLEQYAYEPYGTVIAADNLDLDEYGVTRHAVNRVGFQGLFFERYDGSYFEPSIAPGVAGMYYARNRFYSPSLGRFLQRDPNETGLPIIAALAMNGRAVSILMSGLDAQSLYGGGMNLYAFAGANPVNSLDPSGMLTYQEMLAAAGTVGMLAGQAAIVAGQATQMLGAAYAVVGAAEYLDGATLWLTMSLFDDWNPEVMGYARAAMAQGEKNMLAGVGLMGGGWALKFMGSTLAAAAPMLLGPGGACFVAGTPVLLDTGMVIPIEEARLGQAVASSPDPFLRRVREEACPDPVSRREVHLRIDRADGATTDAYLLRPQDWLDSVGATTGNVIMIDMPEMAVLGPACVCEISPCPEIVGQADRSKGIVTGRFVTSSAAVLDLFLDGYEETIRTTAAHPFWSLDRNAWVRASELS